MVETDSVPPFRSTTNSNFDVVIVGAGIAGASLGYALGKAGRNVCILERDLSEPDRIVGELLQPGGYIKLKELGLGDCLEGIDAADVHGYGVLFQNEKYQLPYPPHENQKVIGKSFHHGRFIQKLREAANSVPNVELRQGIASKLVENEEGAVCGVTYKSGSDTTPQEVHAPLTIVCDGCFSNFRSKMGASKPISTSHFVGVVMNDCTLPFPSHGHVVLADPGPILLYQIASNDVRVLVDIPSPLPSASTGALTDYLLNSTASQLPLELQEPFRAAVLKDKVRSMPNQRLHTNEGLQNKSGVIMLGDSWNMRHPLTGGGMTVAFSDVYHLSQALAPIKDLGNSTEVKQALVPFFKNRKPLATTINVLAQALYNVFTASGDPILVHMRLACLGYFRLGGSAVAGPMSLLSGLCSKPSVLMTHFFSVALYGVYLLLTPFPTPRGFLQAYQLLGSAAWIVIPLMRGEGVFQFFTSIISLLFATRKPKHLIESQ